MRIHWAIHSQYSGCMDANPDAYTVYLLLTYALFTFH